MNTVSCRILLPAQLQRPIFTLRHRSCHVHLWHVLTGLPWSMTVYHTGQTFVTHRKIDIYFDPDYGHHSQVACLELEFTSFSYVAVKLAYSFESKFMETLVFRSMESLEGGLRLLRVNVTPEMTKRQRFYVVVQIRSDEVKVDKLAIIKRLKLLPNHCARG